MDDEGVIWWATPRRLHPWGVVEVARARTASSSLGVSATGAPPIWKQQRAPRRHVLAQPCLPAFSKRPCRATRGPERSSAPAKLRCCSRPAGVVTSAAIGRVLYDKMESPFRACAARSESDIAIVPIGRCAGRRRRSLCPGAFVRIGGAPQSESTIWTLAAVAAVAASGIVPGAKRSSRLRRSPRRP
jgi:hypothetical protein